MKSYSSFFTPLACSDPRWVVGELPSKEQPRPEQFTHRHHVKDDISVTGNEIVHLVHLKGSSQKCLDLV